MYNDTVLFVDNEPVNSTTGTSSNVLYETKNRSVKVELDSLNDQITVLESTINKLEFRDITADFDNGAFSANLEKYHAGNYIKKGSYLIMLADYDTYYGGYDSYATVSTHHWVGMVFGCGTHNMNGSNTTSGGYKGSGMHSWLTNTLFPAIRSTFGAAHFMGHQKLLSNGSEGGEWVTNQFISLPSEAQIYGACPWSYKGFGTGEAYKHLELFRHNSFMEIFNKGDGLIGATTFQTSSAWLRDISAGSVSANFCVAYCRGDAVGDLASRVSGAFPLVNLV